MKLPKGTYIVHVDMKASTAFKYETGGSAACDLACCVESVNSEVTPRVTRAGATSGLIQKETHWKKNHSELQFKWSCFILMGAYRHDDDQASWDISMKQIIAQTAL